MALGRREAKQAAMWVAGSELPRSPGHGFYEKLNRLLDDAGFDRAVEELCRPYYDDEQGRPGIPPGVYFRMLFVGYFEQLSAQRAIAWKCADSLSVRAFLGIEPTEDAPDHSSLTRLRKRLPLEVHVRAFALVLEIARQKGVLRGKTLAVDATTLEANAAMKSLQHRVSGEDWTAYLRRLAQAEGMEDPSDEELRRFDRRRKGKKVSNAEWRSATDADARIAKMKDGRTHFAYKAEHAVDVGSGVIVAAQIYHGDDADGDTVLMTVESAHEQLQAVASPHVVEEVLGDKGYHKAESLAVLREVHGVRTYIPEPQRRGRRIWVDKPAGQEEAVRANRRRCRGRRGRALGRRRSEFAERSFAHTCETGGARRTWLRGMINVAKRYWIQAAAHNLGKVMRALFGVGTPRALQGILGALHALLFALRRLLAAVRMPPARPTSMPMSHPPSATGTMRNIMVSRKAPSSTGC
jgi:transposase